MVRAQAMLIGSALIKSRETLLEMLHPIFDKMCCSNGNDLVLYDHFPVIATLIIQYCEKYIPVSTEEQEDFMKVIASAEDALNSTMLPNRTIVLVNLIVHLRTK